ncbi:MAG: hypothetical protein NTV49_01620 [Kiritimatiellaeota bacterium]|nr:hypothetical protein [Kiritimatiellota bacterium]
MKNILMLGQLASFTDLEVLAFDFERVLKKHGVKISNGTELESAVLAVIDLLGKGLYPGLRDPLQDIRPYFSDILGLWTFMTKIVRLQNHKDFKQLVPHLELLNNGKVVQNQKSLVSDDACNKLFELLLALICMDVGIDLRMDGPQKSVGDNPDVICTIEGRRWGFACKVPFRETPKSLFDNLRKGIDQIEVSPAKIGCVVFNYRNLIDHAGAWPILNEADLANGAEPVFGCHHNPMAVAADIQKLVDAQQMAMDAEVGRNNVEALFVSKKSIPAFLVFGQTTTGVTSPRGPAPSLIGTFSICPYTDCNVYMPVLRRLNDAMHEFPGGHGPGLLVHRNPGVAVNGDV